jgi:hypothetical protein
MMVVDATWVTILAFLRHSSRKLTSMFAQVATGARRLSWRA